MEKYMRTGYRDLLRKSHLPGLANYSHLNVDHILDHILLIG